MGDGQIGELMENVINPADGERNTGIENVITLSHEMVVATALDVPINIHRAS